MYQIISQLVTQGDVFVWYHYISFLGLPKPRNQQKQNLVSILLVSFTDLLSVNTDWEQQTSQFHHIKGIKILSFWFKK